MNLEKYRKLNVGLKRKESLKMQWLETSKEEEINK